jgi:NAD(P)-dependent dehydrogenase (short-subunit alcohol dehydrogenase family)
MPSSPFGKRSTAEDVTAGLSLAGKNILITGCNSGIGHEAARVLAMRGARVMGTSRTGRDAAFACELADPASVRACVAAVQADGARIDALICNAGIMALPKLEQAFGVELQLFTNHIGHFILVTGLLEQLADNGRVVMLSSSAHRRAPAAGIELDNLSGARNYAPWTAYGQSKLANLLFAKELARRFAKGGSKRTANAVHPGVIATNLTRHMNPIARGVWAVAAPLLLKTVPQGAATTCYVAVHPDVATTSGEYFADCNIAPHRKIADDVELAQKLWAASEEIVARLPQA